MASFQVSYTPAKNQRDKKAQWFFRDKVIQVVCRVSEKLLRLAPQGHFLRGVYEPFYDAIKGCVILENEQAGRGSH